MDFPQSSYYKWNKILLFLVGQWPYQGRNTRLLARFVVLFYLTVSITTQTAGLIRENFNVDILFEILPIFLTVVLAFVMTFLIYKQNDKFEEMFRRIREDWASEKYDEEMKIKESYAQTGTVITKYITLTGCVSGFFFVFTTCFLTKILDLIIPLNQSRPLILPFNDDYFIDQEKYYYLILIHANLTVLVIITFFVANETIFCVHIHHIYGMLAVLGYRLEFIIPNLKLDSKNQTNPYYDSISWCIQCHQETLEFGVMLKAYYSASFFVVTIIFLLIASPTMVQISNVDLIQSKDILQFILYFTSLFLHSYLGQKLLDMSTELAEKIYFSNWQNFSPRTQRLLLLFIKRCERPCSISAFSLYLMSLNSFRTVTQTGFSYFMVLKQLR